jgi:hypothetical protein
LRKPPPPPPPPPRACSRAQKRRHRRRESRPHASASLATTPPPPPPVPRHPRIQPTAREGSPLVGACATHDSVSASRSPSCGRRGALCMLRRQARRREAAARPTLDLSVPSTA